MGAKEREQLAARLGITSEQLRRLSGLLSGGRSGVAGTGADSATVIAEQLSVSLGQLKQLRAAVNGASSVEEDTRRLVHGVMAREGMTGPVSQMTGGSTPARAKAPGPSVTRAASSRGARRQGGSLINKPKWITADRPRSIADWTPATTVFVTMWGDKVHLYADCDGTRPPGQTDRAEVQQVSLSDRICAARTGCLKCCGEFWSGSSMAELKALIDGLHGRVDESPNRRRRAIIAEKINLRFGKDTTASSSTSSARSAQASPKGRAMVTSAGKSRPPRSSPGLSAPRAAASTSGGKAAAKRERARQEAARLGITEAELKARRRAENEANRARNAR